ncbi:MAG: DUF4145 domain-containing protein [Armatimonadetes bacterium]|nr:DUF4145 domain-containing protein [Armatimonadota bacterium]
MLQKPPFSWTCPYCQRDTTVNAPDFFSDQFRIRVVATGVDDELYVQVEVIVCPNQGCKHYTLEVAECDSAIDHLTNRSRGDLRKSWRLVPASSARQFPDYVPSAIRDDYIEACAIVDLSPKAAAALARRCLQGMIRDFWSVEGPTLKAEIESVETKVEPLTWKAIDAVRSVGNIGAHMEKDINLIIDVDTDEAALLIWLIERLVTDWYEARHERQLRLTEIVAMADEKEDKRENAHPPSS